MGKLMTDATGQQLKEEIKKLTNALRDTMDFTAMELPPDDGKPYVMKNGKWSEALINTGTTDMDTTPTQEVVNEGGQASVTFYFPWKCATHATSTLIKDKLKTEWRFPYDEGTVKSIAYQTGKGTMSLTFMVDDTYIISGVTAKTTRIETAVDFPIAKGQKLEIKLPGSNSETTDLTVTFTMDVGHKTIEFIGQADLKPNVYVRGYYAANWSANGEATPDGQFQLITMPSVVKLYSGGNARFCAKGEDGRIYICSSGSNTPSLYEAAGVKERLPIYATNARDVYIYDNGSLVIGTTKSPLYCFDEITHDYIPTLGTSSLNSNGYCMKSRDSKMWVDFSFKPYTLPNAEPVRKGQGMHVLSESGELYTFDTSTVTKIDFPYGRIKNFWTGIVNKAFLILNEDNELYAMGTNTGQFLGVSQIPSEGFARVGVFDVRKIVMLYQSTLLMTADGKLYHAGTDSALFGSSSANSHTNGFVHVFPNYRFYDMAYSTDYNNDTSTGSTAINKNTLVAIAEYLGEIAE